MNSLQFIMLYHLRNSSLPLGKNSLFVLLYDTALLWLNISGELTSFHWQPAHCFSNNIMIDLLNESVLFKAGFLLLSIIPPRNRAFWYPPILSRIGLKLRDIFTILGTLNNSSDWLIESLDSKINIKIIIKPLELLINDKCKFFKFLLVYMYRLLRVGFRFNVEYYLTDC